MKQIITNKEIILGEVLDFYYGDGLPNGVEIRDELVILPIGSTILYGPNPHNCGDLIIFNNYSFDVEYETIIL